MSEQEETYMVAEYTPEKLAEEAEGIRFHYDLPVEFFRLVLGDSFTYSAGYYRTGKESLDEAQANKLALFCKKLELSENDHLLDIGVGWGNLAFYAAQNFGCKVTGVSLSPVQKEYVLAKAKALKVAHLIQYDLVHALALDYPDGYFTKIGSLEATEHIMDLPAFYQNLYRMLADDGIMCIQVITRRLGIDAENFPGRQEAFDFMYKYIYPVGRWSSISESISAMEQSGFEIVDVESLTDHYYLTQRQWYENLQSAYPDRGASTGVTSDRYLAQILFAAGSVDTFARGTNLDYQVLTRKNKFGAPRRQLQLDRSSLLLDGASRQTNPPLAFKGQVELEIVGSENGNNRWYVDLEKMDGIETGKAPNPVCSIKIEQSDLLAILTGQLAWHDAFVEDKIKWEGDLTAALWVRGVIRSPFV
jgi:cyclopropane-fatty-acyl-phospholipid synthase